KCITVANPFGGRDVDVSAWDATLTPGSHHSFLFLDSSNRNGSLQDCSGLTFAPFACVTQQPQATYRFPPGVAMMIPHNMGFRMIVHFLNAGSQTMMASVSYTAHLAPSGTVMQRAGPFFFNNAFISIPPDNMPHPVSQSCSFQQNVKLLMA